MKNAFYFMLKTFSFLRYLIFFGHVEKRVDKNVKLSFKIYHVTHWETNFYKNQSLAYFWINCMKSYTV